MKFGKILGFLAAVLLLIGVLAVLLAVGAAAGLARGEITLYALQDSYDGYLSIPEEYPVSYQIELPVSGKSTVYRVVSGDSVTVTAEGFVTPAVQVWYWNGGIGSSWPTGAENERVEYRYNFGASVVKATIDESEYYYSFTVTDYASYYAQSIMQEYVQANITDTMSDIEKLYAITSFPTQYIYDSRYSGYTSMIVFGGGDCWASTAAILYMCDIVGLPAHIRYAANDFGAGSGHRNAAVQIGDEVYIADAGYYSPRTFSVKKESYGFSYSVSNGNATITQYDGFDSHVTIPDSIDGYPVTAIGDDAFWYGESYSGQIVESIELPSTITSIGKYAFFATHIKEITLPNSLKTIGEGTFGDCASLVTVDIPSSVVSIGDHAFRNCTSLSSGQTDFKIPDSVTHIGQYAFYGCSGISGSLTIPASVEAIWMNAFDECAGITAAKFVGNAPTVGDSIFGTRGNEFVIYYQSGKSGWTTPTWNGYKTAVYDPTQEISLSSQSDYSIKTGKIDGERIIAGVSEKTDCKTFLSSFENTNLVLCNADGETLNDDYNGYVGTGFKLKALDASGTVIDEVTIIINGEISGDGEIDATDRMILARFLAGWEGYEAKITNKKSADIDGDGEITAKDRMLLARYLARWTGYDTYFK